MIFDKEYVNKNAFHRYKKAITINKGEIQKLVLSKKDSYGNKGAFKYFIGYVTNAGIMPLCIRLPQMNECAKYFDNGSKCMKLLVHDEILIKNTMKYEIRLNIYLKKNLVVNQCIKIKITLITVYNIKTKINS